MDSDGPRGARRSGASRRVAGLLAALAAAAAWADGAAPGRLDASDAALRDPLGERVVLRGANLEGVTEADAALLSSLGMNFARLRVSFEPPNTAGAGAAMAFTPAYRAELARWLDILAARGIWTLIEMRANDELTNGRALYDTYSDEFGAYRRAWLELVALARDRAFIAGYGLLAEPSANRSRDEPESALTAFQLRLMDAVTIEGGDARTPFFVGPDWNYDSLQYRHDEYFAAFARYRGRLVYEVNMLAPKPWIKDGSVPAGVPPGMARYPQPARPLVFLPACIAKAGPGTEPPERLLSRALEDPAAWPEALSPGFVPWFLAPAAEFAARHRVPMLIDQFGASVDAAGWREYERDLVLFAEARGLSWCRWSLNAGSPGRMLSRNPEVAEFYRDLIAGLSVTGAEP